MFFAKTKIMIEVIPLVFQGVERFIFYFPSGASTPHKLENIFLGDGQIGDPCKMLRLAGFAVFFPVLYKGDSFILVCFIEWRIINNNKTMR